MKKGFPELVFKMADLCKFEKIIQKNKKKFSFMYYLLTPNPIKLIK
jgi:hypothetical protein